MAEEVTGNVDQMTGWMEEDVDEDGEVDGLMLTREDDGDDGEGVSKIDEDDEDGWGND